MKPKRRLGRSPLRITKEAEEISRGFTKDFTHFPWDLSIGLAKANPAFTVEVNGRTSVFSVNLENAFSIWIFWKLYKLETLCRSIIKNTRKTGTK